MKGSLRLARQLQKYAYRPPDQRVDNLVIGAGVIGLAVGARLREARPDQTTIVVERHGQVGLKYLT
jgi:cation diffusion facilitator CzcD-associated flavoprotein CzcO